MRAEFVFLETVKAEAIGLGFFMHDNKVHFKALPAPEVFSFSVAM